MSELARVFLDAFEAEVSRQVGQPWEWIGGKHDPALRAGVEAVAAAAQIGAFDVTAEACVAPARIAAGARETHSYSPAEGVISLDDLRPLDGRPLVAPEGSRMLVELAGLGGRHLLVANGIGGWWPEDLPAWLAGCEEAGRG